MNALNTALQQMEAEFKQAGLGYHFPILWGADINKALNLRKAGLGSLANIPGDDSAQPVIEDTAVDVNDLPEFIAEFNAIMDTYGQKCVHYAHAGSGEIHLRPVLNMKTPEGHRVFCPCPKRIETDDIDAGGIWFDTPTVGQSGR